MTKDQRLKEPQPDECITPEHHVYNGRHFYGPGASERAEVTYLRDWKRWAEQELRGYTAWARSVNEALNTGDGSYRP